jgi:hypothetical protein
MKLSILSENSVHGTGIVGSSNVEDELGDAIQQGLGRKMFKTLKPNVERLPDKQKEKLPQRDGPGGIYAISSKYAKYFNSNEKAPPTAKAGRPIDGVESVGETDINTNDPLSVFDPPYKKPWEDDDTIMADDSDMKVR